MHNDAINECLKRGITTYPDKDSEEKMKDSSATSEDSYYEIIKRQESRKDQDKLKELEKQLNEIKEIYLGMDGFNPETAPEAYLQFILNQIYDLAIK